MMRSLAGRVALQSIEGTAIDWRSGRGGVGPNQSEGSPRRRRLGFSFPGGAAETEVVGGQHKKWIAGSDAAATPGATLAYVAPSARGAFLFFFFCLFRVIQQHAEHSKCPPGEDPASDSMRTGSRSHPSTELHQAPP